MLWKEVEVYLQLSKARSCILAYILCVFKRRCNGIYIVLFVFIGLYEAVLDRTGGDLRLVACFAKCAYSSPKVHDWSAVLTLRERCVTLAVVVWAGTKPLVQWKGQIIVAVECHKCKF